ncbi:DNA methyltransferase [Yoonia sp. 2307UL14-13]|uniref:DNA methyltransferase n=1 Tax=Yoonia sp. 2307UL14-13 TaxID=3126506 RepID=UPI0030975154
MHQDKITVSNTNLRALKTDKASIVCGDAMKQYAKWDSPTLIVSDGPYGLGKFPGEPHSTDGLADWYAPHAAAWAKFSNPFTTLWFWNSEIGWAKSHSALEMNGWQYEETVVWDKGVAHIAGNVNSRTIRGLPVVTEIAVRYTRKLTLADENGYELPLKEWLRHEWQRSGLPLSQNNEACGVKNAATRKYLTQCHLWYFPPGDAIVSMSAWCTKHGKPTSRPYFTLDGINRPEADEWDALRAKWTHTHAMTNVWRAPPVHGGERVRNPRGKGYLHANQKPVALMERQIIAASDPGDVIWEPFGGLMSATIAAVRNDRRAFAAELNPTFYEGARKRLLLEKQRSNMRAIS